jgi:hypothetical protein
MASRKEIVERELGVSVPEQYARFLDNYGIYNEGANEVYGFHERLLGWDGIPCVIGATNLERDLNGIDPHWIVVYNTGFEGELVLLNSIDGTVHRQVYGGAPGETLKIADCFDDWFETEILAPPAEAGPW